MKRHFLSEDSFQRSVNITFLEQGQFGYVNLLLINYCFHNVIACVFVIAVGNEIQKSAVVMIEVSREIKLAIYKLFQMMYCFFKSTYVIEAAEIYIKYLSRSWIDHVFLSDPIAVGFGISKSKLKKFSQHITIN